MQRGRHFVPPLAPLAPLPLLLILILICRYLNVRERDGEDDTTKCTHCGGGEVSSLLSHFKVRVRLLSLFHGALYTRLGTVRGRHPRTGRTYVHFMSTFCPFLSFSAFWSPRSSDHSLRAHYLCTTNSWQIESERERERAARHEKHSPARKKEQRLHALSSVCDWFESESVPSLITHLCVIAAVAAEDLVWTWREWRN